MKNLFIVFDGMDGSGKSLMISVLAKHLRDRGYYVFVTKEPTEGRYGLKVRELLKRDKYPEKNSERCLKYFVKDREEHVNNFIKPFLEKGIVICDRYYYSTIAFQSTQGISLKRLIEANTKFPKPDTAFILDLEAEIAIKRIEEDASRFNKEKFEKLDFMKKLRRNFLKLKKLLEDNIIIIDASKQKEAVFQQIKEEVEKLL